jgi:hypothetical protein
VSDFLADLATYIDAQTALTFGTDLFIGDLVPSPDDVTILYEYPGVGPIETFGDNQLPAAIRPHLQVVGRAGGSASAAYNNAKARVRAVYNLLVQVNNEAINGAMHFRAQPIQEPFMLHRDENDRVVFACNFDVWRVAE